MANTKKNAAAAVVEAAPVAQASAAAEKKVVPPRKATARTGAAGAKAAKPLDPAVQASKDALAKALAAAQSVKIEKPLGKPEKAAKGEKEAKGKKGKLVRDSFTMPEGEYAQIAALKKRLLGQGREAKKSEILRAGVALLAGLDDVQLAAALARVEVIKTGRPAKAGK